MEQPLDNGTAFAPIDRTAQGTPYGEPQGEIEQAIAKVWRQVFRLEQIGRNDNFFELGGDSAMGMQLVEMTAESLALQLPVVILFLNPTIREMAELATSQSLP
jgi:hypothetical protein